MYDELTEVDIKKMQEEINYRTRVLRPQLIEEVQTARAFGDLSENYEYKCAKQAKNRNDSRIRYLENMIKNARVVSDQSKVDEVGLNDTVTLYCEDDEEEDVYRLVTSIRGNSLENKISIESPLGKAIRGCRVGERAYVKINDKAGYYVEIRKIEKTGDDGTDAIRSY